MNVTDRVAELHESGYTIVSDMLSTEEIARGRELLDEFYERVDSKLDAPGIVLKKGNAVGREQSGERPTDKNWTTNLVSKNPLFADLMSREPVIGLVRSVLGDDCILSSMNSLEPLQGYGHQELHRDEGPVGPEGPVIVNTLWVFDEMDQANGATRIVPGTQDGDELVGEDDERLMYAEVPAGSVLVVNAHMLHAASRKEDGRRRRVAHVFYAAAGRPTQTDWDTYVPDAVRQALDEDQLRLLGLVAS